MLRLLAPLTLALTSTMALAQAHNPILHADVPDMAMVRVGDAYYMSSTTMFYNPGVPIMRSTDLVNWKLVNYAYPTLGDADNLALTNNKNSYAHGSWASSIRFHDGTYYVSTFSISTGKTYIYSTKDIEHGPWKTAVIDRLLHDHSLVFDTDGRTYMIYGGGGPIRIIELTPDASALKPNGVDQILIQDPSAVAGPNIGLKAEGSQLVIHDGKYYLFNICWPKGGMRTELVHRADRLLGPYEGKIAFQDKGIAQGSLIDTPDGHWYAYLFRDSGAVGRIPYLLPATWTDGWPVIGTDGKAPDTLPELPPNQGPIPGLCASDEFDRKPNDPALPLVWQWNHNPVDSLWSLTARPGFLRLTTDRADASIFQARNTLTQRTFGPTCSATAALDVSALRDGDLAALSVFHATYGLVGVKMESGHRRLFMSQGKSPTPQDDESLPLPETQTTVYLRATCDFQNRADTARFSYSLDAQTWTPIGHPVKLVYALSHFVGNRFALLYYSTTTPGGHADFDYFRLSPDVAAR